MKDPDGLSWQGIELIWVVMGFIGAALGIGSMPPMSRRQMWVAFLSGLFFAAMAPQWADWGFQQWAWANPMHEPMPRFMGNTLAFFFGVGGMFLVPGMIAFWRDPWGVIDKLLTIIDRLRGKAPPSPPPDSESRQGEHP